MNQLKLKIEKIILKHFPRNSVHGLSNNNIPVKKLENAKSIHNINKEEVFFLYDATLFGSAKDGMLVTEKGIYWKEVLDTPNSLDYRELVESTANKDLRAKKIFVLGQDREIEIKENYYKFIYDLRSELISSSIIYETYYNSALLNATENLGGLLDKGQYIQIIEWLKKYEGLFLKPKDKPVRLREISFQAYLKENMFPKAKQQLEFIQDLNPRFYSKALTLLELAIKEERYDNLQSRRIKAIQVQDFKEAYILIEEQRLLGILSDEEINKLILETKEAQYRRLNNERLEAIKNEDYEIAFSILEKQSSLSIKQDFEIEMLRQSTEDSKDATIKKYVEKLDTLLENEEFLKANEIQKLIYKIDPSYPLERERILLDIYKYDFRKAKEEISKISKLELKLELEQTLQKSIGKLHNKIRDAAKNRQYEVFEKYPEIWNYKDEYGMCALDYFALEADLGGILKSLDHLELLLMPANIFGHNFIDLLGFACDPNLGNKKENPLHMLKEIKGKLDIKHVDDRIKFLETGQERHFFSYKSSQEDRLSELNKKLLSTEHFKHIFIEVENPTMNSVNKIIRHLFSGELEDLKSYPQKDEFETSEVYRLRARAFRRQYLARIDFIAEYKRQNQSTAEGIEKILKQRRSIFIPSISGLIEYKDKELDLLKSLEVHENVLKLLGIYFPISDESIMVETGIYNADKEVFLMDIDGQIYEMPMPLFIAKEFKNTFEEIEFKSVRIIEDGEIITKIVPRYSNSL